MNPSMQSETVSGFSLEGWRTLLFESAGEVFELMVGSPLTMPSEEPGEIASDTTAMVGLAGTIRGVLSIRCSKESACRIASKMLCIDENDIVDQNWDAIGEICNMVAGNFKSKIDGLKEKCMLSVPTVIVGQDYEVYALANEKDHLEVPVIFESRPVLLALEIHR